MSFVPALLVFGIVAIAGIVLDRQAETLGRQRMRDDVTSQVSVMRAKLEGNIASNVQLVRGLVSVLSTEPDMDVPRFNALASSIFKEQSQLRSVAAAPNFVVTMTYPLEGNERAIGLDYRQNTDQWNAVRRAMETGRLVLAGPLDLVQGGTGLIGRFPVFVGEGEDRSFWGIVSAVIDVDKLYVDSGILRAANSLDIAILGHDGRGNAGKRFFGTDLTDRHAVSAYVALPSGTWQILAAPKGGWQVPSAQVWLTRAAIALGGALIILPFWIGGRMFAQRYDYIERLRQREAELVQQTRRLNLALETSRVGLWELDLVSGEEVWDARTNEIYGLPTDGASRKHDHWQKVVHPDDRARAEREFRTSILTGRYTSDYRVQRLDGTIRNIRSIAVLQDMDGEKRRVMGVNWDVTDDVALNNDLRQANAMSEARNIELEAAKARIEHNALHDSLTGLPNRRYLDETLRRCALAGYQDAGTMALLHIDLDRFKHINDTLGHAAGDAMLIHASKVLRANCRDTDFVARIGGDEFVVLSSNSHGEEGLARLAGRLVEAMRKPVMHEGHECRFGVSVGIATAEAPDIDVKQLLINADIALYRAKDRGRNRYEFFSSALQAEVITTKRIADEILTGLEANAFVPHYQPQFCARTHELVGVEALARWKHTDGTLKSPDKFMAVAEELSVVAAIDRMILEQVLVDLDHWQKAGVAVPRASVNVSQRRLHDEGLIESLRQLDIAPGRIAFELVESIYLDESDGIVGWNIDQIKALGIDVEIDDFGTGYASIVSLQNLRPKRLKIDRQLVDPILTEASQRRLVSSIVDIGKSMDIEIIAEGVETMEHAAILSDLGCDILQGFAFARPMSREDLTSFIERRRLSRAS